jgi:hypothetical protein
MPSNVHHRNQTPGVTLLPVGLDAASRAEADALGEDQRCERVHVDELLVVREGLAEEAFERDSETRA